MRRLLLNCAASKKLERVSPNWKSSNRKWHSAPQKGWEPGARFFYVLLAQGLDEEMHLKVFADIDGGEDGLETRSRCWIGREKNGFDKKKAAADWDSPAVTKDKESERVGGFVWGAGSAERRNQRTGGW